MAYIVNEGPGLIAQKNGLTGAALWVYKSVDSLALVAVAGYFTNGYALGMKVGDQVVVVNTTTGASKTVAVAAVVTDGAASIAGGTQELLASGVVTPGIQIVELNHASTIIAATIASLDLHPGILIVKNTSGSGTTAHTLTVSGGTFDGTNNTATLNAPDELLIIHVDGDGVGTVVQNTGSVGLSSV
jgi:hypothetical protein